MILFHQNSEQFIINSNSKQFVAIAAVECVAFPNSDPNA